MHSWCRCHFNPVVDDWDKWLDDYEQRHTNAGNHLQDIFKDDKIKTTRISQQAYDRLAVPKTERLTAVQNKILLKGMKKLLEKANGSPENTEFAYYYDINAKFLKWDMGKPGKGSIGIYNPHIDYIVIHNHPSGGTFSQGDIKAFNNNEKMKIMIIVGNNGNQYLIRKRNNYNTEKFLTDYWEFIIKLIKQETPLKETLNKCSEFILNGAEKYGYEYRKII